MKTLMASSAAFSFWAPQAKIFVVPCTSLQLISPKLSNSHQNNHDVLTPLQAKRNKVYLSFLGELNLICILEYSIPNLSKSICCMKHLESVTCYTGMMWLMLLPWTFVALEDFAWKRFLIQCSLSEDILIRRWITAQCMNINNYVELLSKDSAQKAARLVSLSPQTALRFKELPPAALYS